MRQKVAGFNLQIDRTDPPGNNLWTRDPDGHLIQFSAPQNPTRPPGAGVGGVLVGAPGGGKQEPAFQPTRITRLTLRAGKFDLSAGYYRRVLGEEAEGPQKGRFRVGLSELVLGPGSGGEYFRVGVSGFDPRAAVSNLKSLGLATGVVRNDNAVSFRDPDGIQAQIGA